MTPKNSCVSFNTEGLVQAYHGCLCKLENLIYKNEITEIDHPHRKNNSSLFNLKLSRLYPWQEDNHKLKASLGNRDQSGLEIQSHCHLPNPCPQPLVLPSSILIRILSCYREEPQPQSSLP